MLNGTLNAELIGAGNVFYLLVSVCALICYAIVNSLSFKAAIQRNDEGIVDKLKRVTPGYASYEANARNARWGGTLSGVGGPFFRKSSVCSLVISREKVNNFW